MLFRSGQLNPVRLDVIATEGEARVLVNMRSKAERASAMFEELVAQMNDATTIKRTNDYKTTAKLPKWL